MQGSVRAIGTAGLDSPSVVEVYVISTKFKSAMTIALLAVSGVIGFGLLITGPAAANECAAQCYAQENACRRATSDDPKCGADLTRCLQACRTQK